MRPRLFLSTPLPMPTQERCERADRGGAAAAIPRAPGWSSRSWATGKRGGPAGKMSCCNDRVSRYKLGS